ncbi:hypothetical protein PA01_19100 [Azoarcus sp. PA01]|nr:hypothetical protein PA01_19100 [Azoarcus sp. PA01]
MERPVDVRMPSSLAAVHLAAHGYPSRVAVEDEVGRAPTLLN